MDLRTSAFDVSVRQNLSGRIIVALERISEAFRVLLWESSKETGLSPIQIQILIYILFHKEDQCNVSYLANEFNLTKATISDSVKVLLAKQLVSKKTNTIDTRSYSLSLTEAGRAIAGNTSHFADRLEKPLHLLTDIQKETFLQLLLEFIDKLNKAGIITAQRMCFNCSHYKNDDNQHYCTLLKKKLATHEVQIDCVEHEKKDS